MSDRDFTLNNDGTIRPFVDDVEYPYVAKPKGSGIPTPPSSHCVYMNIAAPMPFLRTGAPADGFRKLRKAVIDGAGFDFLARVADMMRDKNFNSGKIGVANRSRHKCGDAFDYDQTSNAIVVISEPQGLQQFFRTWLRCAKQDGSLGIKVTLKDIRGHTVSGFYFDFTACAERLQWRRIPAWKGWSLRGSGYNKMEFWHYQLTEGLSFDEAMTFLYSVGGGNSVKDVRKPNVLRVLGLNDRGSAVRNLQDKLSRIVDEHGQSYLPREEVDGVYGKVTQTAVKRLQERFKLDVDGLVGTSTRQLIETLTAKH